MFASSVTKRFQDEAIHPFMVFVVFVIFVHVLWCKQCNASRLGIINPFKVSWLCENWIEKYVLRVADQLPPPPPAPFPLTEGADL